MFTSAYGNGRTPLAPIPGSPYQSSVEGDKEKQSPTTPPKLRVDTVDGKGKGGMTPSPQQQSRTWSKGSSNGGGNGGTYRSPLPQSLDAAAELFAQADSTSPPRHLGSKGKGFSPQMTSSPVRPSSRNNRSMSEDEEENATNGGRMKLSISIDRNPVDIVSGTKHASSPKGRIVTPKQRYITSSPAGDVAPVAPATPSDEYGSYFSHNSPSLSSSNSESGHGHRNGFRGPHPPPSPLGPALPSSAIATPITPVRGPFSAIKAKGIGLPVLDAGMFRL